MDDLNISNDRENTFQNLRIQEKQVIYNGIIYKVILPSNSHKDLIAKVIKAINPETQGSILIEKNRVVFESNQGKKTIFCLDDVSRLKQEIQRESDYFLENAKTINPKILTRQLKEKKERLNVCQKIFSSALNQPALPPLLQAILKENQSEVRSILKSGVQINQPIDGITPIEFAIQNRKGALAKELIALGAKIHKSERLFKAIEEDDAETIDILVELGCKLEKKKHGRTPINFALDKGKLHIALKLKSLGAEFGPDNFVTSWSLIERAIYEGNLTALEAFKQLGFNYNAFILNEFPLSMAIALRNKESIDWLTKNGGAKTLPSEKTIQAKLLAHVWGLKGNYSQNVDGQRVDVRLEGFRPYYPLNQMAHSLMGFNKLHPHNEKLILIQKMLEEASIRTLSPTEALEKIQADEPFVISSGFLGHSITYTFCNEKLFIANRGLRDSSRKAGIEVYDLPKNQVTEELLKTLINYNHKGPSEFEEQFEKFKLKYLENVSQKPQKVGNCSWASSKSSFFALLIGLSEDKDIQRAAAQVKPLYKQFTLYERVAKLREYVPEKEDGLWPQIADKMAKNFAKFAKEHRIEKIPLILQENTLWRQLARLVHTLTGSLFSLGPPPCSFEKFQEMLREFKKASDPFYSN